MLLYYIWILLFYSGVYLQACYLSNNNNTFRVVEKWNKLCLVVKRHIQTQTGLSYLKEFVYMVKKYYITKEFFSWFVLFLYTFLYCIHYNLIFTFLLVTMMYTIHSAKYISAAFMTHTKQYTVHFKEHSFCVHVFL